LTAIKVLSTCGALFFASALNAVGANGEGDATPLGLALPREKEAAAAARQTPPRAREIPRVCRREEEAGAAAVDREKAREVGARLKNMLNRVELQIQPQLSPNPWQKVRL